MNKSEAKRRALLLKDKWEQIVTDAYQYGFLSDNVCMGCGKVDCGGCPCGTMTKWHPDLKIVNKNS